MELANSTSSRLAALCNSGSLWIGDVVPPPDVDSAVDETDEAAARSAELGPTSTRRRHRRCSVGLRRLAV
jgi:hypothetical protein